MTTAQPAVEARPAPELPFVLALAFFGYRACQTQEGRAALHIQPKER